MWLPAFHCGVEVQAARDAGYDLRFYKVSRGLVPDLTYLTARIREDPGPVTVVHYFGHASRNASKIAALCDEFEVPLVEDACHGPISHDGGPRTGTCGVAVAFSLRKVLGTPDGGVAVLNDSPGQGSRPIRVSVAKAPGRRAVRPMVDFLGGKLRLWQPQPSDMDPIDPLQPPGTYDRAISLLSERYLRRWDPHRVFTSRRSNWLALVDRLRHVRGFEPVVSELDDESVPLSLALRVERRDDLAAKLLAQGVDSYVFGRHPHPAMPLEGFPETREMRSRILGVPVQHTLTPGEIDRIADALTDLLPEHSCER